LNIILLGNDLARARHHCGVLFLHTSFTFAMMIVCFHHRLYESARGDAELDGSTDLCVCRQFKPWYTGIFSKT